LSKEVSAILGQGTPVKKAAYDTIARPDHGEPHKVPDQLSKRNLKALRDIFGDDVRVDEEAFEAYGRDWTRQFPLSVGAVVFPRSRDDVVALVSLANEVGMALVPSGGRTGLSGGAVASAGEIVVAFDRMNRIVAFDPADRLVTCEAGVKTAELQGFAKEKGLYYPVDFASAGSSTIGGNIATNAGGIKVIRYGLTRDWVAGVTVVTGRGELMELNRGLVKNATGYDLRHLFIGAEGTLGFVVDAQMKLAPTPGPSNVMVLGVRAFSEILNVLGVFHGNVGLSAFEFFSDKALAKVVARQDLLPPFETKAPFYALLELDSEDADFGLELFDRCVSKGWVVDGVMSQSEAQAASLWRLREDISESIAHESPYKHDVSVRVSRMPDLLSDVEAYVGEKYPDLEVIWFGHIGDGNLHINILKPTDVRPGAFFSRCHEASRGIFEIIRRHEGSISAEHGVGLVKRDYLGFSRSEAEVRLMRELKNVLDPNGVMNPGKIF
jgi:FAD/FMN-containing dehydrogenase